MAKRFPNVCRENKACCLDQASGQSACQGRGTIHKTEIRREGGGRVVGINKVSLIGKTKALFARAVKKSNLSEGKGGRVW